MPVVDGREYRAIEITEFKTTVETIDGVLKNSFIVEGYATTFDEPYDFGFDGAKECICKSALDLADMSDVVFQYDHTGRVLARQRNNTLAILPDDHGLFVRADLSGSEQGRSLYEEIKNGLIDRMSWAFIVAEDGWEYDRATRTSYVTKIDKVFDVSAVSIPANEGTEINARSYFDGVIEKEQQELLLAQKEREARARLALRMSI